MTKNASKIICLGIVGLFLATPCLTLAQAPTPTPKADQKTDASESVDSNARIKSLEARQKAWRRAFVAKQQRKQKAIEAEQLKKTKALEKSNARIEALEAQQRALLKAFEAKQLEEEKALEAAQEEDNEDLEARFNTRFDGLEEKIFGLELNSETMEQEISAANTGRLLNIYGFFDLTFFKRDIPRKSAVQVYLHEAASFMMSNLNLYVSSQMTETLSAMIEFRFSFLPHGLERSFGAEVVQNGEPFTVPGIEYERENLWQRDPLTSETYWRGSVGITRARLTYSPRDWLNIRAGRFLTPVGIWNIDHAPNVVLPIQLPYMMIREIVPLTQTGLYVFGYFFPEDRITLEYGLTLSNGRAAGATNGSILDFDDGKAVGVRLRASYETSKLTLQLGAYGYYSGGSDRTRSISANADDMTMKVLTHKNDVFTEKSISADFLLSFAGFKLQSEYTWKRVDYSIPDPLEYRTKFLLTGDVLSDIYGSPSTAGFAIYGLISYTLPLSRWIGSTEITPYLWLEKFEGHDTQQFQMFWMIRPGINIKPSPYVTIKLEYERSIPDFQLYSQSVDSGFIQLAVSF